MKPYQVFLVLAMAVLLPVENMLAIPAFARKYNMSCNTCHLPFPRLKPYGDEFARNGFQLEGKEPPRAFRDTGDDLLLLMRELPLALRFEGFLRWLPQNGEGGRTDAEAPYLLKLLSGGQIAKNISYYFYFFFGERGEVAGLEDAFIMFNNLFGEKLDLYVGQFQVSDPLFKRELRLELEDYRIYKVAPGTSAATLEYDRGLMMTYDLPSGTDIVLEVLNGAGIGAMSGGVFDTDKYKNFVLRVSQDAGEHLRIGAVGYYGKEEQSGQLNSLWMLGPDLTLSLANLELNLQYVARQDDNPFFHPAPLKQKTQGGMAELIYMPDGEKSTWFGALLYNNVTSDDEALKYESATAHFSYLLARNFRLVGEYTYDLQFKANKVSVGLVCAF